MDHDELGAWLRLTLTPGIGNGAARRLLARFGLPQSIFQQTEAALQLCVPAATLTLAVAGIGKRALPRMAALIHLKVFQRLGYFSPLAEVPPVIREHLAQQAGAARPPGR